MERAEYSSTAAPLRVVGVAAIVLPALALVLQVLAACAPGAVERVYARGLYPVLADFLSRLSGALPFSAAEALLVAGAVAGVIGAVAFAQRLRRSSGRRWRFLGRAALRIWAAAFTGYLLFLLLWGLNYRRQPLADSLGLTVAPQPTSVLAQVAGSLVEDANRAREGLEEDEHGVVRLREGLSETLRRVPRGFAEAARVYPVLAGPPAVPKAARLSPLLSRLAITGIFCPFTAEAHVNADVPAPDVPFTASHELAHLRGFAREDEASYAGYLACLSHPDPDFRYSGLLLASAYVEAALARVDAPAAAGVQARRTPGVKRDLDALRAWSARYRGRVQRASHRVNDAYLRAQGQADGIRSYGRMVDLLLAERQRTP